MYVVTIRSGFNDPWPQQLTSQSKTSAEEIARATVGFISSPNVEECKWNQKRYGSGAVLGYKKYSSRRA
jgi:hypothetical protein